MKKLAVIVAAILFMAGYTASAQMGQNNNQNQQQGMTMQKGGMMHDVMGQQKCPMCGQMMNQDMPMKKYEMMVDHLPIMQQQLSLDNSQVEELIDLQTEFKKGQIDYQAELRKKQMKLKSLLDNNAPVDQIKNHMEACSETKINMKVAAYETAGKMKGVLTADQQHMIKDKMKSKSMMQDGVMNSHKHGGMMKNQNNN